MGHRGGTTLTDFCSRRDVPLIIPLLDTIAVCFLGETRYLLADIGAMPHRVQEFIEAEERYNKYYGVLVVVFLL